MSSEQHPGGVAGRVIEELSGTGGVGDWEDGNVHGAQRMHTELSREARAILAELDREPMLRHNSAILERRDREVRAQLRILFRLYFTKLGLLEGEDAE